METVLRAGNEADEPSDYLRTTSGLPQGYLKVTSRLSQGSRTTKKVSFSAE